MGPIRKIGFLVHNNQYDSKREFTRGLAEAFERLDITTFTVDTEHGELKENDVERIQREKPDLLATFSLIVPGPSGGYLCDELKIPHLSILVDPLIYSLKLTGSAYNIMSCVDRRDCEWLEQRGYERIFFLPHAVNRDFCRAPEEDRQLEVVFIGSCYDHEKIRASWKENFSPEIYAALSDGAERLLADDHTSLVEAFFGAWQSHALSLEGHDMGKLCMEMDYYARGKDRFNLINAISNAEVHIFGEVQWDTAKTARSWGHQVKDRPNIEVHPPIPYTECLRVLTQAKICLNSCPFFKHGTHERIFNGMAAGCAVVTNRTTMTMELFQEGEEVLLYGSSYEGINEKVRHLLDNEEERVALALAGQKNVLENHTWDQRAETILAEISGR